MNNATEQSQNQELIKLAPDFVAAYDALLDRLELVQEAVVRCVEPESLAMFLILEEDLLQLIEAFERHYVCHGDIREEFELEAMGACLEEEVDILLSSLSP